MLGAKLLGCGSDLSSQIRSLFHLDAFPKCNMVLDLFRGFGLGLLYVHAAFLFSLPSDDVKVVCGALPGAITRVIRRFEVLFIDLTYREVNVGLNNWFENLSYPLYPDDLSIPMALGIAAIIKNTLRAHSGMAFRCKDMQRKLEVLNYRFTFSTKSGSARSTLSDHCEKDSSVCGLVHSR